MPWCPNCKNEYVDGVIKCADCDCDLVDSLETMQNDPIYFGEKDELEDIARFLTYNQISSATVTYNEGEDIYELYVDKNDTDEAKKVVFVFLQQKQKEATIDDNDVEEAPAAISYHGVYEDSAKKAEEYKSGAYTLLLVGGLGIIALILFLLGILPIHILGTTKYLMVGVMGTLFILFFIMGILSFKSSKKLERKAVTEINLTKTLQDWCQEHLTANVIDAELNADDSTSELLYFQRTEYIKELINKNFVNLKPEFLDHFVDELYPTIFEN